MQTTPFLSGRNRRRFGTLQPAPTALPHSATAQSLPTIRQSLPAFFITGENRREVFLQPRGCSTALRTLGVRQGIRRAVFGVRCADLDQGHSAAQNLTSDLRFSASSLKNVPKLNAHIACCTEMANVQTNDSCRLLPQNIEKAFRGYLIAHPIINRNNRITR
jgi:hypothetical protein